MSGLTIVVCTVIFVAVGLAGWLVFWSRRRVNRIDELGCASARELNKVLHDER